jgi:hypothetical protein
VNMLMNLQVPLKMGNLLTSQQTISFSGRNLLHGFRLSNKLLGYIVEWKKNRPSSTNITQHSTDKINKNCDSQKKLCNLQQLLKNAVLCSALESEHGQIFILECTLSLQTAPKAPVCLIPMNFIIFRTLHIWLKSG